MKLIELQDLIEGLSFTTSVLMATDLDEQSGVLLKTRVFTVSFAPS